MNLFGGRRKPKEEPKDVMATIGKLRGTIETLEKKWVPRARAGAAGDRSCSWPAGSG